MDKIDYQVLIFLLILVIILNCRENFYQVGYTKRPVGYYSVHYTGFLQFMLTDSEIAWVKSPDISSDITFDNISDTRAFFKTFRDKINPSTPPPPFVPGGPKIIPVVSQDESHDLIMLIGKFGGKLDYKDLSSDNMVISRKNVSKEPGGPLLSEKERLDLEKEYLSRQVLVTTPN